MSAWKLLLFLLPIHFLIGCGNASSSLLVYSTVPEAVLYAELYNSKQEFTTIHVQFQEDPFRELKSANAPVPDIIIAPYLNTNQTKQLLLPLKKLSNNTAFISRFYPSLIKNTVIDNYHYTLPLSFNLPLIVAMPTMDRSHASWLTTQELQELSINNTSSPGNKSFRLGFPPTMQPDFLYEYLKISGTNFQEDEASRLTWNNTQLQSAIQSLRSWRKSLASAEALDFENRYLRIPLYRSLEQGYLTFIYNTVESFFELPQEHRWNKDFFWLSSGKEVYITDDVIYVGITRASKNSKRAEDFLSWLLSPETHERILEEKSSLRLPQFGIAGRLSSLEVVNKTVLPRYYRKLTNRVPPGHLLKASAIPMSDWKTFKQEKLLTWLTQTVNEQGNEPLESILEDWYENR